MKLISETLSTPTCCPLFLFLFLAGAWFEDANFTATYPLRAQIPASALTVVSKDEKTSMRRESVPSVGDSLNRFA